jgi:hypothetical protein
MQENKFSNDENSLQGLKNIHENGLIYWTLVKKEIDIAYKNKSIDPELKVRK